MDTGDTSEITDTAVNLFRHISGPELVSHNRHIVSAFGKSIDLARMNLSKSLIDQILELGMLDLLQEIHDFGEKTFGKKLNLQIVTLRFYSTNGHYGQYGPSKLLDLILEIADKNDWTDEQKGFAIDCLRMEKDSFELFCFFDPRLQKRLYTLKNESHRGEPSYKEILLLEPNSDGKYPEDISSTELIETLSSAGARAISLSLIINSKASDLTAPSIGEFDKILRNKLHYQGIKTDARDMRNLLSNLPWGPDNYVRNPKVVIRARELVENHPVVKFWGWGGIGKSALAFKLLKDFSDEMIQSDDASPSGTYFEHFLGMSSKVGSEQGEYDWTGSGRLKSVDATTSPFVSLLADADGDDRSLQERLRGSARRIFKKIVNMFEEKTEYDDDQLRELALKYLMSERILLVLDNLEDLSNPKLPPDPSQSQKEEFHLVSKEYGKIKRLIKELEDRGSRQVKSRIIITTRIHTEAEGLGREFEVPRLDNNESMDLFIKVIENRITSSSVTPDNPPVVSGSAKSILYEENKNLRTKLIQITKKKSKITQIFTSRGTETGDEGTHPLIVLSAAWEVTTSASVEDHLNDWMKGNDQQQEVLVYCCKRLLGSMNPDELEVVRNIVTNRDIIGKRFFTFEDLERYEVFLGDNYAENNRIIKQFVGWNWVRTKSERTNTFYHWLPEIVESIHASLNIDSSEIFGREWRGSDVRALSRPKELSETEERKISDDARLLDTWEKWLETNPDLTKDQGDAPPWKESKLHRDILYNVHSSAKKISIESDIISDEQLSRIYCLSTRTIRLFNESHTRDRDNKESWGIIAGNLEGVWEIFVKSSINIVSRFDNDTHPKFSARDYICMALHKIVEQFHDSRSLHEYMISSVSRARPNERVVGVDLIISTCELLKFAIDTYSQDGFISTTGDMDDLTRWIELQAVILEPVPADHRVASLNVNSSLSINYRDWLRIYMGNEEKLSDSPEVRERLKGHVFWMSLRLYLSSKPTESKRYDGAEKWRDQEFLLAGYKLAKHLSHLAVDKHYRRAIGKGDTNTKWIWEDEELCIHVSKGYSVSSGALVYVSLLEVKNWAGYESTSAKPAVSIRCELKTFPLPGIYLARIISHERNRIHCEVLFGEDGYLTEIPDNQIRIKLDRLLAKLQTSWGTMAHTAADLSGEINAVFPDTTELKWLGGVKTDDIIKAVVEYSRRSDNSTTLTRKGGYVGFSVENWPPPKPKYIQTHADSARSVIFGPQKGSLAMPADPSVLARIIIEFEQIRSEISISSDQQMTYEQLASQLMKAVEDQAQIHIPNTKTPAKLVSQFNSLKSRILSMRNNHVYTRTSEHASNDLVDWTKLPNSPKAFLVGLKEACIDIQNHKREKFGKKSTSYPGNLEEIIKDYFDDVKNELP